MRTEQIDVFTTKEAEGETWDPVKLDHALLPTITLFGLHLFDKCSFAFHFQMFFLLRIM